MRYLPLCLINHFRRKRCVYVCLHHLRLSSRSLPPSLMDHNLEPQPHDDDKHSATLGHAMPVRTHAFTARGALQSQSSHQLGSEGEPLAACVACMKPGRRHSSNLRRRVLCCTAASYPAPPRPIFCTAASYPAPPRLILHLRVLSCAPILHRRVLSCTATSYPALLSCTPASYPAPQN